MEPTAWIFSIQFEFWSPQLHQHLRLHSTWGSITEQISPFPGVHIQTQISVFLIGDRMHVTVSLLHRGLYLSEWNNLYCLQAKAPDAKLMTIREDAEELESTLNKLDQEASYICLIIITSPQSHFRKACRSSANKKNSKLLVSHISRNLGHGLPVHCC